MPLQQGPQPHFFWLYWLTHFSDETDGILPRVRICADGSLCCDNDNQCCSKGDGRFLDNNGKIADRAPSTTYSWGPERTEPGFRTDAVSSTATTAFSTTKTSSAVQETTSVDPVDDSDKDSSDGDSLKLGLGVGIPVGCTLIVLVAMWLLWRRRRRGKQQEDEGKSPSQGYEVQYKGPRTYYGPNETYYGNQEPTPHYGGQGVAELDCPWYGNNNSNNRHVSEMEA